MKKILLTIICIFTIGTLSCFNDDSVTIKWTTSAISPAEVVSYVPVNNPSYNDSSLALDFPAGAGQFSGSTDVVSLGFDDLGNKGYIILRFNKKIINGTGTDFKVFENVMQTSASTFFIEAAYVYMLPSSKTFSSAIDIEDVLSGSTDWEGFPCTLNGINTSPSSYNGCAGLNPVISNKFKQDSTPRPEDTDSGGDFFDLNDLPDGYLTKTEGFYYIMIIDAGLEIDDPGIASTFGYGGFDLDAVAGINYE